MTAPDAPTAAAPSWPEDSAPARPPGVSALAGNRAALGLLIVQNVVSAVLIAAKVPLGTALLGSFAVVVLMALTVFRAPMRALLADTRWRTPPAWGVAIAAFVLGFLASRALVLAFVAVFPDTATSVPQFTSTGADLWVLFLTAGLLIPFAEEVAFRGLMMRGHERAAGFGVAAVTSTLAFSLAHGVPASIAGILPLAYVLARVVQHTGSLWNGVIVHALNNMLAVGLGSLLAGRNIADPTDAQAMLANPALKWPLAGGALVFGLAVLFVIHLWMTPKPDPQARAARGPWLSAAYVVIVLFGLLAALLTVPALSSALTNLRGVLR